MKRILLTTTVAVGVAVLAMAAVGGAIAQGSGYGPGGHMMRGAMSDEDMAARHAEMFKILDTDGDGTVSSEEFANREQNNAWTAFREARRQEARDARFAAMDTNGDGTISAEEWSAVQQQGRGYHKGRMGHWQQNGPQGNVPQGQGPQGQGPQGPGQGPRAQ